MNKELKYLKIFEAFESIKLSKTLNYIKDPKSKNTFMELLKTIANQMDLPLSKYSDEYFQYLPFNKALNLNFTVGDEPCNATSEQSYSDFGVPGATCDKGMIDRKWGRSIRKAKCTVCDGTGIKKKSVYPIKWLKFWFDKDGKYITTTGTDGQVRKQVEKYYPQSYNMPSYPISTNESDYDVVKTLSLADIRAIPKGTIVKIKIGDPKRWIIGLVWKDPDSTKPYIIQNECDGSTPDNSSRYEWESYGRYSWVIGGPSDYSGEITELKLKPNGILKIGSEEEDLNDRVDPYTWNAPLNVRYGNFSLTNDSNVEKLISNAHFALVLNYLDIKASEFKTKREISTEREQSKEGASAFISDQEFREKNIQRYIDEISKRLSISNDIKELGKTIQRFMGGPFLGIYILRGRNFGEFSSFVEYFYKFITLPEDDSDKDYYLSRCLEYLRHVIDKNLKFNSELTMSINEIRYKIRKDDRQELEPVLDDFMELNKIIINKFQNFEYETLEDLEIFLEKIQSIRKVYRDSERLRIRDLYYFTENMNTPARAYSTLNGITSTENILLKIQKFKKFVERL